MFGGNQDDYWSTQLRRRNNTPVNALPQRPQRGQSNNNNNNTQPFEVNPNNGQPQRPPPSSTTSTFRRRQHRQGQGQRQNRLNNNNNNNRFAILADDDEINNNNDDNQIEEEEEEEQQQQQQPLSLNKKNKFKKKTKKSSFYLSYDQIFKYISQYQPNPNLNSTTTTTNQDPRKYKKLNDDSNFWAKEIINRTRGRDNIEIKRFVDKKINYFQSKIDECIAIISNLQIEFSQFWTQIASRRKESRIPTRGVTPSYSRPSFDFDKMDTTLTDYINQHTKHIVKNCKVRLEIANAQKEEYQALKNFETITKKKSLWNTHLILKPKLKNWFIKSKNFHIIQRRIEYNLLPKFITKNNFSFKFDTQAFQQEDIQPIYNEMHQITNSFQNKSMQFYYQIATRELNNVKDEIDIIIENCRPKLPLLDQNVIISEGLDGQPTEDEHNNNDNIHIDYKKCYEAFENYYKLSMKRYQLEAEQSSNSSSSYNNNYGLLSPNIINEAPHIQLTEDEQHILKLGPRFIFDDPKTASKRRTNELATLRNKLEKRFYENKVKPGRPVQLFIDELDVFLQNYHNIKEINPHIQPKKHNFNRIVKRLKYKFRSANVILRKTDKSKVFHLATKQHYQEKSDEYMNRTQAYKCLNDQDPLPDLIQPTNRYLLDLRLAHWINQKYYEQLYIKTDEVKLAHLYYLPKAHKPGTPLRPIISGLKYPTIKISKFLDDMLRPLFNQIASKTTVTSGFELLQKLQQWSTTNLKQETIFCTNDVVDLFTMIPQVGGVLALRKMLIHLKLKEVNGLKIETIIRLARFVIQNNYFKYNSKFYHQVRGGAMGSPLTLTIANCYMFFFEQDIARQIKNSHGLYIRYIDDIYIAINWPKHHLIKQIDRWNGFDSNIKLSANINLFADFLDLHMENRNGILLTSVFHKPSYEPYYLPFYSVHPLHMKKNIPFAMLIRGIRYCSTFEAYLHERDQLRLALLLNQYPIKFIDQEFNHVFYKFDIHQPLTSNNYNDIRQLILNSPKNIKQPVNYGQSMFFHFTYCSNMKTFPRKFRELWNKYFSESPINDIIPMLGTRNVPNLNLRLVQTRNS
ncbi:unnamed protein product [Adineta ricciae]|uniref:Reverse transcriptase domain-containing protein n=1 Tax=Adineta ricciae TaxID=249248 RepID=A0A814W9S0_ADIRI|nr:unnamed protein product [Adineta ricciae]CAF1447465.1 unnamed protein product [Adineta ricciae]